MILGKKTLWLAFSKCYGFNNQQESCDQYLLKLNSVFSMGLEQAEQRQVCYTCLRAQTDPDTHTPKGGRLQPTKPRLRRPPKAKVNLSQHESLYLWMPLTASTQYQTKPDHHLSSLLPRVRIYTIRPTPRFMRAICIMDLFHSLKLDCIFYSLTPGHERHLDTWLFQIGCAIDKSHILHDGISNLERHFASRR